MILRDKMSNAEITQHQMRWHDEHVKLEKNGRWCGLTYFKILVLLNRNWEISPRQLVLCQEWNWIHCSANAHGNNTLLLIWYIHIQHISLMQPCGTLNNDLLKTRWKNVKYTILRICHPSIMLHEARKR